MSRFAISTSIGTQVLYYLGTTCIGEATLLFKFDANGFSDQRKRKSNIS